MWNFPEWLPHGLIATWMGCWFLSRGASARLLLWRPQRRDGSRDYDYYYYSGDGGTCSGSEARQAGRLGLGPSLLWSQTPARTSAVLCRVHVICCVCWWSGGAPVTSIPIFLKCSASSDLKKCKVFAIYCRRPSCESAMGPGRGNSRPLS